MTTEGFVLAVAVGLWFAHGWYLNERLKMVHRKLERVLDQFDGLRRYLYEIDPQFNDERGLLEQLDETDFAGSDHMELIKQKQAEGRRTLNTPFA